MDEDSLGVRQLADAAVVCAARRRIDEAIADLAARPFEPTAAAGMRQALASTRTARAALHRLRSSESAENGPPPRRRLAAAERLPHHAGHSTAGAAGAGLDDRPLGAA